MAELQTPQIFDFTTEVYSVVQKRLTQLTKVGQAAVMETLGLIIARYGIKPGVAMNTLSGRFRRVVLGVIVIVAVVSCCHFPPITSIISYAVVIGSELRVNSKYKGPYVEWKSQHQFDQALKQVCDHHGTYCIYTEADTTHTYKPSNPPSNCTNCSWEKIRAVKVTKSKAADQIAAGESVANDPNVMHHVQSTDPGDIVTVLDALKTVP